MWAEATFQVDLRAGGGSADVDADRLRGYPGITLITADTGRQVVVVNFDPEHWTPATLAGFVDRLSLPWVPVPAAA
jgi:hypothetical protein